MGEVQTTFEFQRFLCTDFMFLKGASWSVSQDYTVLDWDGERTSEGRRGVSSCLWLWLCNLELSITSGRSYHSSLKVFSTFPSRRMAQVRDWSAWLGPGCAYACACSPQENQAHAQRLKNGPTIVREVCR